MTIFQRFCTYNLQTVRQGRAGQSGSERDSEVVLSTRLATHGKGLERYGRRKTYQRNQNNFVLINDREVENSLVHGLDQINVKFQVTIFQLVVKLQEATSKSQARQFVLKLEDGANKLSELLVGDVFQTVAVLEELIGELKQALIARNVFAFARLRLLLLGVFFLKPAWRFLRERRLFPHIVGGG